MGDNSKTMEVNEFSCEVLSTAVDFMYGIEIPEDFSDGLKSLLHMADQYLMEDLKDAVSFHIGKDLTKENIFDISNLAETFGAMALSEKCAQFIFDNVGAIEDEKLAEARNLCFDSDPKHQLALPRDCESSNLLRTAADSKRVNFHCIQSCWFSTCYT